MLAMASATSPVTSALNSMLYYRHMYKSGIKRKEKIYLNTVNRASGTITDCWITVPVKENVVGLEWVSCYGVGDQFLLSIDGYNSGRHSNGVAYWRVLDSATNQRSPSAWEEFMPDSHRQKLNNFHLMLYTVNGLPASPSNPALTANWGIELDVYCID